MPYRNMYLHFANFDGEGVYSCGLSGASDDGAHGAYDGLDGGSDESALDLPARNGTPGSGGEESGAMALEVW